MSLLPFHVLGGAVAIVFGLIALTAGKGGWLHGKSGTVFVYHAQERVVNVPKSEATGRRGGIHNSLTRIMVKPTHLIGGYAQLSFAFNYLGPTGNQRDEVTVIRRRKSQKVEY